MMRTAIVAALGLAMAAGGFQLTRIAGRDASGRNEAAGWVRTDGQLVQLGVIYLASPKHPSYRAVPLYSYEVDGRRHTGNGMFVASSAPTLAALKRQLQPWLTDPAAVVFERPDDIVEVFSYRPSRQSVPVYYDPRDPVRSAFGEPSTTTAAWKKPVWWFGVVLMFMGVAVIVPFVEISVSDRRRRHAHLARLARTAAGLKTPSEADKREFVRVIDNAIHAVNAALPDPRYRQLQPALDALRAMRRKPAAELLYKERTGLGRWLSGELEVDNWGPAGARVVEAVRSVDAFHERWRQWASSHGRRAQGSGLKA